MAKERMSFQQMLAHANDNVKVTSKFVDSFDQEVRERELLKRDQYERELMREREEKKRRAPPKEPKKYVIPKKKPENSVNPAGLQSFIEKQRKAEVTKELEEKKKRDELIRLRLRANQGKANKKIAAQLGKSPIELQQKYAPNPHLEMELLRRQQREEEQLLKESNAVRESIGKAVKDRAALLARSQTSASTVRTERTRVGNVKAGGFADVTSKQEAILTKRKAENVLSGREMPKKPKPAPSAGSVLNFKLLMEKAQQNSDVKDVAARSDKILRPQTASHFESSREVMKRAMAEQNRNKAQSASIKNSSGARNGISNGNSAKLAHKVDNPYAASDHRILSSSQPQSKYGVSQQKRVNRGDRPAPPIPQPPPKTEPQRQQRILPGDIRYKGPQLSSSKQTSSNGEKRSAAPVANEESKAFKPAKPMDNFKSIFGNNKKPDKPPTSFVTQRSRSPPRSSSSKRPASSALSQQRYESSSSQRYDRFPKPASSMSGSRSNPAMFNKRRNGHSSSYYSNYHYSDESERERGYDDEDEYDSEMDDFIDDSEVQELETADFEESLKSINRNYDKRKWLIRERMIDERGMDAKYRDIEAEERRSAKFALMEDYLEARKGSKGIA